MGTKSKSRFQLTPPPKKKSDQDLPFDAKNTRSFWKERESTHTDQNILIEIV